jgi:hypothetical protein
MIASAFFISRPALVEKVRRTDSVRVSGRPDLAAANIPDQELKKREDDALAMARRNLGETGDELTKHKGGVKEASPLAPPRRHHPAQRTAGKP